MWVSSVFMESREVHKPVVVYFPGGYIVRSQPTPLMKGLNFICTSVTTCVVAFSAVVLAQQKEKGEPMEGKWICESAIVDGKPLAEATVKLLQLTLTKDRYKTVRGPDVLFDSDYIVDASQTPAHIDIVGTEGDLKGRKAQGIYSLAGDTLKICYTMPGKDRPTVFESVSGSGAYFIVWKRWRP